MKYRRLGKTGLIVSEIGFGAWGIGGDSYGITDDSESIRALRLSFDKGINFFDTADIYGAGRSERIIGKALKAVRDKIIIASKVGVLDYSGRNMAQDFSVDHIKRSIEGSLRRLQTDYIDLYQLHSPHVDVLSNDEILETLVDLKMAGKARVIGISVRSPRDGIFAISKRIFETIQVNFNMIDHRLLDDGLLEFSQDQEIAIIARTPLCFGFLSGKILHDKEFGLEDHRAHWSKEQLKIWAESIDKFKSLYTARAWTPVHLSLKFCLAFKGIPTVIPGMTKCSHVEENAAASDIDPLSPEELAVIRDIYKASVFFVASKD